MSSRHRLLAGSLVLLMITLFVYFPAIEAGFIWDDDSFLTENPLIHADDGLYRFWFTTEAPDYFPLTSSMLWFEWRLWGTSPMGYHVVNIILHCISSIFIWFVLRRLRIPGAWFAALIFAVHPVNVESVAWITERKNTLPMAFFVLSILLYLVFEDSGRRRWYVFSLLSFVMALLSKTSVVMLPFVLLGCVWWRRGNIGRKDVVRSLPFFALSLVLGLITVWFQYNVAIKEELVRADGPLSRLAVAGKAVWFYVYKALLPYRLSFVYPRWEVGNVSIVSFIPLLVLILSFAVLWGYRGGWGRGVLFAFGYYVLMLFPVLGFFNIYFMRYSLVADHWQYHAIIGIIALFAGMGVWAWPRKSMVWKRTGTVFGAAVVVGLGIVTWNQSRIYKDRETLYRDTISKNQQCCLAHFNLGQVLFEQGRLAEAMEEYLKTLRITPGDAEACYNLGIVLDRQDRTAEAIDHYLQALRIKPGYAEAHNNLGAALGKQGRTSEAIDHYIEALRIKPDYVEAHNNLGAALGKQGRTSEAIDHYLLALQIKPDYVEAYNNLGIALGKQGRTAEAIDHYLLALRLRPDYAEAHYNLGVALGKQGRTSEAIDHYLEALRIKPDYVEAHNNLGIALVREGNINGAVARFREALRINPNYMPAIQNLHEALMLQKNE